MRCTRCDKDVGTLVDGMCLNCYGDAKPRCADCVHFLDQGEDPAGNPLVFCTLNPPMFDNDTLGLYYLRVHPEMYCGQFKHAKR